MMTGEGWPLIWHSRVSDSPSVTLVFFRPCTAKRRHTCVSAETHLHPPGCVELRLTDSSVGGTTSSAAAETAATSTTCGVKDSTEKHSLSSHVVVMWTLLAQEEDRLRRDRTKVTGRAAQLPQEVMSCSSSCFSRLPCESSPSGWCCGTAHLLLPAKLDDAAAAHHTGHTGHTGHAAHTSHTGHTGVSGLSHMASLFPWWQDVGASSWPVGGATR